MMKLIFVSFVVCIVLLSGCLGTSDGAAGPGTSSPAASTTSLKRVFITEASWSPGVDFTSAAGADTVCTTVAASASMSGTWVAWVSDSNSLALNRLTDVSPWYLVDQTTLVFQTKAEITARYPRVGITMTELGRTSGDSLFWTGTTQAGAVASYTCTNWTDTTGAPKYGTCGVVGATSAGWTNSASQPCDQYFPIICFEQ